MASSYSSELPELKLEQTKDDDFSQADGSITKLFHRNVPLMTLYQTAKTVPLY